MELLVKASSTKTMLTKQFRDAVYQSVLKRADAFFNLLDALTVAGHVNSPVALSEEAPYERKFSSIFDTLRQAEFDFDQLLRALYEFQPADADNRSPGLKFMLMTPRPMNARKPRPWKIEDR